ncbi:hypothetical protein AJ88_05930 [Mesorhizobium amorphae CCBAU 01583]|nr:hypothetical protein AJ88_05930 [Mesorhizobium amorphae CCBAU 01583]
MIRCVAEWLARSLERRAWSTFSSTAAPVLTVPLATLPRCTNSPSAFFCVSDISIENPSPDITPVSPIWPPDSP